MSLLVLNLAHSKSIKLWRETDKKITYCYNEARNNAKFIQAMEKCCHSLYLHDPVRMKDTILSLLQTVRLIHSVSQFYNTSERISSLMVKVSVKFFLSIFQSSFIYQLTSIILYFFFVDHESNDRNVQTVHNKQRK